jgi:chromate transporter
MADEEHSDERVLLGGLFIAFLKVSLCGFGGGIVWAHRIAVAQRRWISEEEFADILSLCQFMPGPNVVGIAVCVGARLRGLAGTIAAVSGFLLIPWTIGFSLGVLFLQYAHLAVIQNTLRGVSSTAAGLLIATGVRMLRLHRSRWAAWAITTLAYVGIVLTNLPFLMALFSLAALGIAIAGIENMRTR